ncbi:MAG TPA: hypothetical protein VD767_02245 [Thermomicrobiales bacterium]|nr:hypothetical protein [Thermomicrobiales bacterium]
MSDTGWTFEELLPNGWHPHWMPPERDDHPFVLEFTFYRSEVARCVLEASGSTEHEARERAAALANAWLREHPEYAPRRRHT